MLQKNHDFYMKIALNIARNNLGNTMPNPTVGCIVVNGNKIVGRGCTGLGGRPHAEQLALKSAGRSAYGSTVYITLEPCPHYGNTPPCTDAIINSGVKKVVIAVKDPDIRVNGAGIDMLKNAGISVSCGIFSNVARFLNIGHFYNRLYNRPFVTLKVATTLDGKIATCNFSSKWITDETARNFAHKMRSINDAVLVGSNTVMKDDPSLDCRLLGLENTSPIKIILSTKDNLHHNLKVFQSGETWIVGGKSSIANGKNIKNIIVESSSIKNILSALAKNGITRLMVEGGQNVITQFIRENFVDQIVWIRGNKIGGNDALAAFGDLYYSEIKDFPCFSRVESYRFCNDTVDILLKSDDINSFFANENFNEKAAVNFIDKHQDK